MGRACSTHCGSKKWVQILSEILKQGNTRRTRNDNANMDLRSCSNEWYIWQTFVTCGKLHFTNFGHLSVSWLDKCDWGMSNESIVFVYLSSRALLFSHDLSQADKWLVCGLWVSLGTSNGEGGQVHQPCERDGTDQSNIWQVWSTVNVCKINQSWEHITIIHLVPCTMHNCWCICEMYQPWERGFRYGGKPMDSTWSARLWHGVI
jgi:hypothetical protein